MLQEAVEISVTPRRSLKNTTENVSENMNLVTEIKNICGEKDKDVTVEVVEASLLSRQWRLIGLHGAARNELLHTREKLHLVLQASRIVDPPAEGKVESSGLKIATGKPDSVDNISTSPYSSFVTDYGTTMDTLLDPTTKSADKKPGFIDSMFVVRWKVHHKIKGTTAVGQHFLWLDNFNRVLSSERELLLPDLSALQLDEYDTKLDSHENKKRNKDNVVVFRMEHSSLINHDFQKSKLCLVPITINIVNCYGVPVKVFIDMSKQPNR